MILKEIHRGSKSQQFAIRHYGCNYDQSKSNCCNEIHHQWVKICAGNRIHGVFNKRRRQIGNSQPVLNLPMPISQEAISQTIEKTSENP